MNDSNQSRRNAIPLVYLFKINPFNNVVLLDVSNGYLSEIQMSSHDLRYHLTTPRVILLICASRVEMRTTIALSDRE